MLDREGDFEDEGGGFGRYGGGDADRMYGQGGVDTMNGNDGHDSASGHPLHRRCWPRYAVAAHDPRSPRAAWQRAR